LTPSPAAVPAAIFPFLISTRRKIRRGAAAVRARVCPAVEAWLSSIVMNCPELNAWISSLAASEPDQRARAARAIYDAGAAAARTACHPWRSDAELAQLFSGEPVVGVAVPPETFERIWRASGMPKLADVPPDQDAEEFELHFSGGISLDILSTSQPHASGAIARFLDRHGEGIQQVELPVRDVDRTTALLRERFSIAPIYAETRAGADGTRVNFFLLPVATASGASAKEKILIELVEFPAGRA
jgi:hypothetical protein